VIDDCDVFHEGDWDADCDVDRQDMRGFQECYRGPDIGMGSICRFVFDFDDDDDGDLKDFATFQTRLGTSPTGCP